MAAISFSARKATRSNIFVKVFMTGVSGSGKSYSSLTLASGMADEIEKKNGVRPKIIMMNTESSRGEYYANEFQYDVWTSDENGVAIEQLTPELYVDWIKYQVEANTQNGVPPILIIDGVTPAWDALKSAQIKAGGQFKDWDKVNPRWKALCQEIVRSKAHVIVCARGKTQYVIEGEKGRQSVRKVGVGAEIREGFDFEFTCSFNIDQSTHTAAIEKDNTHIFDSRNVERVLTHQDGKLLIQWANSDAGRDVTELKATPAAEVKATDAKNESADLLTVGEYVANIKALIEAKMGACADLEAKAVVKKMMMDTIKKYVVNAAGKPVADYRIITDAMVGKQVFDAINAI